jgi:hypothetical protein
MMDYQKNIHADSVVREVIGIEPTFLALFGVEALFKVDGARKAIMQVLQIYIERRDHFVKVEHIVEEILESESLRADLLTKLRGKQTEDKIIKSEIVGRARTTSSFNSSRQTGKQESNSSVSSFINSTKRKFNAASSTSDQGETPSPK